ncbi:amino acid adenylation domain-containing protein [Kitasatospora sp. NPDC127059]|uniref:amino acid adenylation domain-containing protein n=1 Tax=unclassified Kitasatospora TaxID=2633591 RepID=UPI00365C6D76
MSDVAATFLRIAAEHPDTIAVIAGTTSWTYRELADRATALGRRLAELTPPGSLVAVEATSPPAGILALLAGGISGRALLPLDLGYPPPRRELVLRDARPALTLREDEAFGLTPAAPAPLPPGQHPRTGLDPVAYVMYTSGSTGTPKGVAVSHRALADRLTGLATAPGLAAGESMLALTALSFDISLAELLLPLQVGATVIAAPARARTEPDLFAELLHLHSPDVVQATPSFWRLVTAAGWKGLPDGRLWCGGEALSRPLAARLLPLAGELWNVYGPTEATIWATAQRITDPSAPIGIGAPLPGTGVHLAPFPDSTEGEILLHGDGLAEGYLDRPDLTAARFVDHPLPHGIHRCYRTGDRARRLPDGTLEFLGRIDQQVKIRGHRVELGDIEAGFESHPAVREALAVVLPADDATGRPVELALFAVLARHHAATPRDLRAWAADRLPRALLPTHVTIVPVLPRTPAGKTDRAALTHQADRGE